MEHHLAAQIVHLGVADLANSPAIPCDPRLDLNDLSQQFESPGINQRFLNNIPTRDQELHCYCAQAPREVPISVDQSQSDDENKRA